MMPVCWLTYLCFMLSKFLSFHHRYAMSLQLELHPKSDKKQWYMVSENVSQLQTQKRYQSKTMPPPTQPPNLLPHPRSPISASFPQRPAKTLKSTRPQINPTQHPQPTPPHQQNLKSK
ncbi:hypothetical protein EX30DRAFT_58427 [Ascodesmis nigricans]|uniref:Uncharacterized protein n=1 Tax=Ascodesmis nigricans TaxID=341454 RepID=A0A4S2MV50_9PEZI|nr:hypothetical protein EX30DRAFT_58427 [Ascodesmis nigricans]